MFIRTVLSSVAAFLLFSTSALAVQPLEIKAVVVDDSADPIRLYIQGENFLNGNELELTLGEDIKLILDKDSLTNTSVTATLPPGNYEGSYQLTATTGGGSVRFDEFDGVTIGAVGPQGPEGVKGDKGDKGDTGASGVDGQDGANCYDGIGTSVADCIGPQGEKGDKGDKGDTGATGDQGVAGADGADGKDGADGAQGPPGAPGLISLITTDSLVGTACDVFGNGGTRVRSGLDADRDGVLVDAEVQAVEYVCNGADGPKGAQGPQGEQGPHGEQGPAGVGFNLYLVEYFSLNPTSYLRSAGPSLAVEANCDAGDIAISGSYVQQTSQQEVADQSTRLITNKYVLFFRAANGVSAGLRGVNWICADVAAPHRNILERVGGTCEPLSGASPDHNWVCLIR